MDEHRVTPSQTAALVETEMGQMEGKEEGGRLDIGQLCGGLERHRRRAGHQVGVGAGGAPAGGGHPFADPGLASWSGPDDLADALHAQRVGDRRIDGQVTPAATVDLVVVEDAGGGANQDLPRARDRLGDIDHLQGFGGAAEPGYLPGADLSAPSSPGYTPQFSSTETIAVVGDRG